MPAPIRLLLTHPVSSFVVAYSDDIELKAATEIAGRHLPCSKKRLHAGLLGYALANVPRSGHVGVETRGRVRTSNYPLFEKITFLQVAFSPS